MTKEEEFAIAFKKALEQGWIKFEPIVNFRGWCDDCDCGSCESQRVIVDYLWPEEEA